MIEWEEATGPDEFLAMLSDTPWRAPDAIVARPGGSGYTLRLSEDTYPNDPNVRRFSVTIPAESVEGGPFEVHEVRSEERRVGKGWSAGRGREPRQRSN